MHMKATDIPETDLTVPVTFVLQDPQALGQKETKMKVMAAEGQSLLEVALANDINIEHACGGVCACSTCHVYINADQKNLSEAEDDELDRVEEAPGLQINSRLSCQAIIEEQGDIEIEVPAWNRNAIKEVPH